MDASTKVRIVYFISIGYAFSIVALAITSVLLLRAHLTWAAALQNLLLVVWGLRLGIFLVRRELEPAYGKELAGTHARSAGMALSRKILIWVGVSVLYVVMFTPSLFVLAPAQEVPAPGMPIVVVQWLGLTLMAGALILEALEDQQKSAFKTRYPGRFCNAGLYRWVRCPNYLGAIHFWMGSWVCGLIFYATPLRWIIAASGLVCIVLIMMGSTKRLEDWQDQRYGKDPAYIPGLNVVDA